MSLPFEKILEIRTKRSAFKRAKKPRVSAILKQTLKNLKNTGSTIKEDEEWHNDETDFHGIEENLSQQISNISIQDLDESVTTDNVVNKSHLQSFMDKSFNSQVSTPVAKRIKYFETKLCKLSPINQLPTLITPLKPSPKQLFTNRIFKTEVSTPIKSYPKQFADKTVKTEFSTPIGKENKPPSKPEPSVPKDNKQLTNNPSKPSTPKENNNNSVILIDDEDDDVIFTSKTVLTETTRRQLLLKKHRSKVLEQNRRLLKSTRTRVLKDMALSPIVFPDAGTTCADSTPKRSVAVKTGEDCSMLARSENLNVIVNLLEKLLKNPNFMKLAEESTAVECATTAVVQTSTEGEKMHQPTSTAANSTGEVVDVKVSQPDVTTTESTDANTKNEDLQVKEVGNTKILPTTTSDATVTNEQSTSATATTTANITAIATTTSATSTTTNAVSTTTNATLAISNATNMPTNVTCATTNVPPTTTYARNTTTYATNKTTYVPPTTTYARNITTNAPPASTYARNTTTHAPPTTTYARNTTTYAPPTSAYARNTTTYAPPTSAYARNTTTYAPPTTTYARNTTTYAPPTTTYARNTTTYAPPTTAVVSNDNKKRPRTQQQEPQTNFPPREIYQNSYHFISENIRYVDHVVYKQGLRPIVIDGSNIAMYHGGGKVFSVKGLKICIDFFRNRGHKVYAFIPSYRLKRNESNNQWLLQQLVKERLVYCTASREVFGRKICSYDDRILVQVAAAMCAVIVSCDNYRDLLLEDRRLVPVIQNCLLMPTFVEDMIIFPQDPLGRFGPSLDRFLRFM